MQTRLTDTRTEGSSLISLSNNFSRAFGLTKHFSEILKNLKLSATATKEIAAILSNNVLKALEIHIHPDTNRDIPSNTPQNAKLNALKEEYQEQLNKTLNYLLSSSNSIKPTSNEQQIAYFNEMIARLEGRFSSFISREPRLSSYIDIKDLGTFDLFTPVHNSFNPTSNSTSFQYGNKLYTRENEPIIIRSRNGKLNIAILTQKQISFPISNIVGFLPKAEIKAAAMNKRAKIHRDFENMQVGDSLIAKKGDSYVILGKFLQKHKKIQIPISTANLLKRTSDSCSHGMDVKLAAFNKNIVVLPVPTSRIKNMCTVIPVPKFDQIKELDAQIIGTISGQVYNKLISSNANSPITIKDIVPYLKPTVGLGDRVVIINKDSNFCSFYGPITKIGHKQEIIRSHMATTTRDAELLRKKYETRENFYNRIKYKEDNTTNLSLLDKLCVEQKIRKYPTQVLRTIVKLNFNSIFKYTKLQDIESEKTKFLGAIKKIRLHLSSNTKKEIYTALKELSNLISIGNDYREEVKKLAQLNFAIYHINKICESYSLFSCKLSEKLKELYQLKQDALTYIFLDGKEKKSKIPNKVNNFDTVLLKSNKYSKLLEALAAFVVADASPLSKDLKIRPFHGLSLAPLNLTIQAGKVTNHPFSDIQGVEKKFIGVISAKDIPELKEFLAKTVHQDNLLGERFNYFTPNNQAINFKEASGIFHLIKQDIELNGVIVTYNISPEGYPYIAFEGYIA